MPLPVNRSQVWPYLFFGVYRVFVLTTNTSIMISVKPLSSLIDKIVRITVSGLQPRQKITLQASLVGDKGDAFESHAYYIAGEDCTVDVCRQASVGGSYTGVEPMGLLWSMKAAPGQRKGLILRKTDVTKPYKVLLHCFDGHSSPHERSSQRLSSVTFEKWYMADGVERIPVNEGRIRGTLFLPEGKEPYKGVIDLSGAARGILEFKASLLACHGFATLALGYYKVDDLSPSVPPYVELEYFEEAAEWLSRHPKICSSGLGINSNCMGSWIGLLLASYRSDLFKGVVATSPWHAAILMPYKYRGKLSSCMGYCKDSVVSTNEGNIYRYAISAAKAANVVQLAAEMAATTPVENITCPVLLAYGTNDLHIDTDRQAYYISEQMKKVGKGDLCSVLRFPNAGHIIEPPYAPLCAASYFPTLGEHTMWGGETKAHALASELAWKEILGFLRQTLLK